MISNESSVDIFLVTRLKTLILAKVPFADGLRNWASHIAPRFCIQKTEQLAQSINDGKPISAAITESGFPASKRLIRMMEGLESNADPAALLGSIEEGLLEQEKVRRTLREIIVYPAFIFIIMSVVIVLYAFTMMEAVYDQGWQHQRPALYWLYSVLHPLRMLLILMIPAAGFLVYRWMKDPLSLPLPGVRRIFLEFQRAMLCQFLQLEFQNRRTIAEALDSAAAFASPSMQEELKDSANHVREGLPLDEDSGCLMTSQTRFFLNHAGTSETLIENLQKLRNFHLEQGRTYSMGLKRSAGLTILLILGFFVAIVVTESFYFYYGYVIRKLPF